MENIILLKVFTGISDRIGRLENEIAILKSKPEPVHFVPYRETCPEPYPYEWRPNFTCTAIGVL